MKKYISVFLAALFLVVQFAFSLLLPLCVSADGESGFNALSPYSMLVDMNTGRVLYEKNADEKIYPASTVKIMTAILALENCSLEDKVEASEAALSSVPDGVTAMDIMPGESLTVRQLLYGAMLASAADATNVLAEAVSGSVSEFVELMNDKAKELGMENTNFSNTHGEHDDRTYTTVRDMAKLSRYAMQNDDFREIVNTDQYEIQPTEKYKEVRKLVNTNYMVSRVRRADYYYDKAIGVKAGYTREAGSCLVEAAKSKDMELLALTFGSETVDGRAQGYIDCRDFFTTAFENYRTKIIVKKGTLLEQIPIKNARRASQVLLESGENLYFMYPVNEEDGEVTFTVRADSFARAPIKKGDVLGECEYFYGGTSAGIVNLVADKDYKFDAIAFVGDGFVRVVTSPLFIIAIIIIAAFFVQLWLRHKKEQQKRRRRMRARRRREAAVSVQEPEQDPVE